MRRWFAALAVPLALLAGCGQGVPAGAPPSAGSGDADFERRAAEMAAAWRASEAGAAWRTGFVPIEDLTVLPAGTGFSDDTKAAYVSGWFRSTARLSTKAPSGGGVRFDNGEAMSVPLVSAADAYRAIDKGDPPCNSDGGVPPAVQTDGPENPPATRSKVMPGQCTALTVTGVRLGTVQLWTSRGEATVPAWLFTVDEIGGPVARVAVAPAAIKNLPAAPPLNVLDQNSVTVDGARLTYPVITGCAKKITPLVYEADDLVVVGAKVIRPDRGVCTLIAKTERVTATLRAPLGDRTVLSDNGQPMRRSD